MCGGTTWIISIDENGQEICKRCECYTKQLIKEKWEKAGINPDNIDKNFKNYQVYNQFTQDAKNLAFKYYNRFDNIKNEKHNSFALLGQSGAGKTHLCIAISINLINNNKACVIYMSYRDEMPRLKQSLTNEDEYANLINKFKKANVLFIDDLFKGKITNSDINIMFEIINYRSLNRLPVIISSEYITEKLLSIDEATAGRIIDMTKGYILEISGVENNYRLR